MSVEELWENFWKEIMRFDFVLPDLRAWQRAAYVITSQTILHDLPPRMVPL